MTVLRRVLIALPTVLLICGIGVAIALPGPQHMLCPSCHGLEKLAPNTFVEAGMPAAKRQHIRDDLRRARAQVKAFYGTLLSNPRVVICRTVKCAEIFGSSGAKGIAYGWHAILLSKSRILGVIATHEIAHIELHWRMGIWGWMRGTVPAWFDEGLATVISEDPRFNRDENVRAVRAVMKVTSFLGQWTEHAREVGLRTAYGAASTRIRQLERRIGRDGLKRFVLRLARDGDFPVLLDRARRGKSF